MANWEDALSGYQKHVKTMFDLFDMEIVIYDEFEKFRHYNDPQFSYPYEKRKNLLE